MYDWRFVVRPAGTHFSSVSLTQDDVSCHGPALFLHVFDCRGRCFLFLLLGIIPGLLPDLYSWTTSLASSLGLACRPLTYFLPFFGCRSFSRDSHPGWGDWHRSGCGLCLFGECLLCCLGNYKSVFLLVTRLGLRPCSAWNKK